MQGFYIKPLTKKQKGIVLMISGVVVLLYAFNFFQQWLNILVICGGFAMIIYGFSKVGGFEKLRELKKRQKKHK